MDEYAVINRLMSKSVELVYFPHFRSQKVAIKDLEEQPYRVLESALTQDELDKIRLTLQHQAYFVDVAQRTEQKELDALAEAPENQHLATEDGEDGELRVFRNIAEDLKKHFPGVVFYLSGLAKKHNIFNETLFVTWEGGKKISKKEVERILSKYLISNARYKSTGFQPVSFQQFFVFGMLRLEAVRCQ